MRVTGAVYRADSARRSSPPSSSTTTGSSPSTPRPFAALTASPGARAFYDELRTRGIEHNDALRRLANRLVGILHGCLKTRTVYDEATAWGHRENPGQPSTAA